MKTIITIILIVFICGVSTAVYFSNSNQTIEVSVLRDVTELHLSQPMANEILPLYGLDIQKWSGGDFHFANISDVSYNQTKEAHLTTANQWLSNEYDRTKQVKLFYSSITQILTDAQKDTIGRWHSSIYVPLANELNRLSQSTSKRRILLVYSDLMENDLSLSFYNKRTLSLLASNPGVVRKQLESIASLNNLSGIEIHLLYQPPNAESDMQFKIVSGFYKQLLESKGATVSISANLQ